MLKEGQQVSRDEANFAEELQRELSQRLRQLQNNDENAVVARMGAGTYYWCLASVAVIVLIFVISAL